jgi:transposase-like protein
MIATLDPEQVRLLKQAGYTRLMTTDVWINQKARRAISSETVERHTRDWLVRWLRGEITRGATSPRTAAPRMARRG